MFSLSYQSMGKGKDLIMLSGFAMDSRFLFSCAQEFAPYYRVHLFDLPGFGENIHISLKNDIKLLADSLLSCLSNAQAIWMGWSLGGLIATWIAIHYPERVNKLINIASSPFFLALDDWPGISKAELLKFGQNLQENYLKTIYKFLALQLYPNNKDNLLIKSLKESLKLQKQPSIDTLNAGLNLLISTDLRNSLSSLQASCLYLLGENDKLVPSAVAPQIASYGIHISIISGASHLPFLSHGEAFTSIVKNFLFR